jgi:predicted enzyme involved in methoxymalonyl-ACP biosynthesis
VRLADRLADSGSVAAMFVRLEGDAAVVDELVISCRALGRRLEDLLVGEALQGAIAALGRRTVVFAYRAGPRNQPALDWLAAFCGQQPVGEAGRLALPMARLERQADAPVSMRWADG